MLKVALTGANGLIGSRIIELLNKDFEFIPLSHSALDITNKVQVNEILNKLNFDLFLHLAAYTNVTGAEIDKDLAYKINRDGTQNVFEKVNSQKRKFIYVSTDFVFDGKNPPFDEDAKPIPLGVYADSKYQGEKIVKNQAMIVRISYPYRTNFEAKQDFFRKIKSHLEQNKPLTMITDSLMTPTFIDDFVYGMKYLINNYSSEIFHLVGSESYSPFKIATLIADKFKLDKSLIGKITYTEYIKTKPGLPQKSDIKSKKNDFYKMKNFENFLVSY